MRKGHGHDLCAPCDRRLGILCVSRFPRQRYVSIFFPEENSNTEGEGASPSLSTDNQNPTRSKLSKLRLVRIHLSDT